MRGARLTTALTCAVAALFVAAAPAAAAELPPYELSPELSLTSDCSTSGVDPVPDPGCPYLLPPAGPTQSNCNSKGCSSRFEEPRAIAIDPYGNEYVATTGESNEWIRVFDDEGVFITELAAPAAKSIAVDSDGNLYAKQEGTIVRYAPEAPYEPEAGNIEYVDPPVVVTTGSSMGALAVDASNDHLFITRQFEVVELKSAADNNEVIESFKPEKMGNWTETLAIDAQRRRLYVSSCEGIKLTNCGVLVIDADTHALLKEVDGSTTPAGDLFAEQAWLAVAVDEELGYFFVGDIEDTNAIYQFSEDYEYLSELKSSAILSNNSTQIAVSNGSRSVLADPCSYPVPSPSPGDACNRHYLFVPSFPPQNRVLAFRPPSQTPPVVEEALTGSIGETEAELQAIIDPRGLDTDYVFEYVTQQAFDEKGFEGAVVAGKGAISGGSLPASVGAIASGLLAGETYRFRVRGENELGAAEEEGQNEAVFTTYDDAIVSSGCPNRALRVGPSARLPDCRAFELVTPPDTNGRLPRGVNVIGDLFPTVHASPSGNRVSFKIEGGSLPGTSGVGSFEGDPYLAARGGKGWSTALAGPSGSQATVGVPGSPSIDQGYSFWQGRSEGSLVVGGEVTKYLRYPDGQLELIGRGSLGTDPRAVGLFIAEDGAHVIFKTDNVSDHTWHALQLEPDAPADGTEALYDRTIDPATGAEQTHVVSLLPGDVTPAGKPEYVGVSGDGEGVAFSIGATLYLRVDNETTYEIGEGVTFAGVSEGGERAFYLKGGDLKALDTGSEEVINFSSTGDVIPVNVAAGGSRAYFVSPSVLGGANPEGDVAQVGEQNLYLSEEGAIAFLATLTDRDVEGGAEGTTDGLGLWTEVVGTQPAKDSSRTNPDGSVLLFQSRAEITGYAAGEHPQVYRYDAASERLHCLSCIPTGLPATGGASLQTVSFNSQTPPPLSPVGFVPNLTPDGKRVFFESTEALVSHDTDEVQDVYQWEEEGKGGCDRAGGCVHLISSGRSATDNYLYAHSEDGSDVFFRSGDRLTGEDPSGTPSIYDARVNGGFGRSSVRGECLGEACRPAVSAPVEPTPVLRGPGNVRVSALGCGGAAREAKRFANRAKRLRRVARRAKDPRRRMSLRSRATRNAKRAGPLSRKAKRCRQRQRGSSR